MPLQHSEIMNNTTTIQNATQKENPQIQLMK